jgi:hypothetical protein
VSVARDAFVFRARSPQANGSGAIVDYFGRENLTELLAIEGSPAISIYMPTARKGADVQTLPLRFRACLQEARRLVSETHPPDVAERLTSPFETLVGDQDFWSHQGDGLAVFASNGFRRLYRLPVDVPELVVEGPTFHTRPLIEFLQAPDRFWILALSQKEIRLWEGSASGLTAVNLGSVPTSLQEALGWDLERDHLGMHSSGGHGDAPIFHGHGSGKDDTKPELEKFFRQVDRGVQELLKDEIGPVILAAVEYYHPIYRGVSRLPNLAAEGIDRNVIGWEPDRIHEAAWPIARRSAEKTLDEAVDLWESSYGKGKVASGLEETASLAVAGRVRLLLTEKGRRFWGHLDRRTGEVEVVQEGGSDPGRQAVDLLDELAELAIRLGGRALVMPAERMPTDTGLATILR